MNTPIVSEEDLNYFEQMQDDLQITLEKIEMLESTVQVQPISFEDYLDNLSYLQNHAAYLEMRLTQSEVSI